MNSSDATGRALHPQVIIVLPIPLAILSTIAVLLRVWVRCFLTRAFGRDDICLLISHVRLALSFNVWQR